MDFINKKRIHLLNNTPTNINLWKALQEKAYHPLDYCTNIMWVINLKAHPFNKCMEKGAKERVMHQMRKNSKLRNDNANQNRSCRITPKGVQK